MADFRAVAAAAEAIVHLLRSHCRPELFDGNELEFGVFGSRHFQGSGPKAGVSLFVYRVLPEAASRTVGGRRGPDGRLQRAALPLEIHFLLTAWAEDPSLQNTIAGWMMRVLEDTPSLPSALLNAACPGVFRPDIPRSFGREPPRPERGPRAREARASTSSRLRQDTSLPRRRRSSGRSCGIAGRAGQPRSPWSRSSTRGSFGTGSPTSGERPSWCFLTLHGARGRRSVRGSPRARRQPGLGAQGEGALRRRAAAAS